MSGAFSYIDLLSPPTNIGTTTPPAIITSTLFKSANSGNVSFVANPQGTGGFQLQVADNLTTGGNARGSGAVDLQVLRTASNQVAGGIYSCIPGGSGNSTGGAFAFAMGQNASADANNSVSWSNTSTRGIISMFMFPQAVLNTKYQSGQLILGAQTTDATPTTLLVNSSAASTSNQLTLQNNSALAFRGFIVSGITGGGNSSYSEFSGLIKRGANAASTTLVGSVTNTLIAQDAGASGWSYAVTADTTNGCLQVTFTGQAATTIRTNCTIQFNEVAF